MMTDQDFSVSPKARDIPFRFNLTLQFLNIEDVLKDRSYCVSWKRGRSLSGSTKVSPELFGLVSFGHSLNFISTMQQKGKGSDGIRKFHSKSLEFFVTEYNTDQKGKPLCSCVFDLREHLCVENEAVVVNFPNPKHSASRFSLMFNITSHSVSYYENLLVQQISPVVLSPDDRITENKRKRRATVRGGILYEYSPSGSPLSGTPIDLSPRVEKNDDCPSPVALPTKCSPSSSPFFQFTPVIADEYSDEEIDPSGLDEQTAKTPARTATIIGEEYVQFEEPEWLVDKMECLGSIAPSVSLLISRKLGASAYARKLEFKAYFESHPTVASELMVIERQSSERMMRKMLGFNDVFMKKVKKNLVDLMMTDPDPYRSDLGCKAAALYKLHGYGEKIDYKPL